MTNTNAVRPFHVNAPAFRPLCGHISRTSAGCCRWALRPSNTARTRPKHGQPGSPYP